MLNEFGKLPNRRSILSHAGAMVSGSLLSSIIPAKAQTPPISTSHTSSREAFFDVKSFGATGKREDNATKPFRMAVEACVASGGGIVQVPPGAYMVGTIQLQDNVTLHIEAGATLFLSQSPDDFIEGARSMIFAEKAKNIAVTGKGTLDGLAQYEYAQMRGLDIDIKEEIELARASGVDMRRYYRKSTAMNVFMFVINDCTNFLLSDVTIINSPLWNVRLNDCNRVFVRGVHIYSDLEKGVNSDGIDICSTSNVTISDSVITTADDAIVIKTIARKGKEANPSENITVTNCILSSSSTALMIGTETEADIGHVLFTNCVIRNSNKGFGINVQDGATVSNVIFSNLTIETNRRHWNWWGSAEMCKFILLKRNSSSKLGIIKDVVVENIIVYARGTSSITGHKEQLLENIILSNVQIFMHPENTADKRATHALKIKGVKGLKVRDLSIQWTTEIENKWQSALVLSDVSDFIVDSFSGRQGIENSIHPAILIDNVKEGIIRNSMAREGTTTFIHVQGSESKDINLKYNHMKKAKKEITFEKNELKKVVELS